MPEGDTIASAALRLRDALVGGHLTRFEVRRDPRGRRGPPLGTEVVGVESEGKHLLIRFADGHVLHTHLQMSGAWHVYRTGERWRKPGHQARAIVGVDHGREAVCFNAPTVELRNEHRRDPPTRALRSLERVGPDLCAATIDWNVVVGRLGAVDPATEIADVLLDQRVAAGIGNVYKSEACWAERVSPFSALADLAGDLRLRLYRTARAHLLANIDRSRRVTHDGGLAVYGKTRRPCPRCRTPIRSVMQGRDLPRRTYWCPTCQPDPR